MQGKGRCKADAGARQGARQVQVQSKGRCKAGEAEVENKESSRNAARAWGTVADIVSIFFLPMGLGAKKLRN